MIAVCLKSPANLKLPSTYFLKTLSIAANAEVLPSTSDSTEVSTQDSVVIPNPLRHHDYFKVRELVKVKDMFEAKIHLGHKVGSLETQMKPFIYGIRQNQVIFDLDQTAELLKDALNFTAHIAYRGGIILFVGQSAQNSLLVENTAKQCKEFAHTRFWRQGMFTNADKIFKAVTRMPDLVILTNTLTTVLDSNAAINEAAKMCIPTVGIVDSNCKPNLITYPVPGNDDTPSAVQYYCNLFKIAILKGKEEKEKTVKLLEGQNKV